MRIASQRVTSLVNCSQKLHIVHNLSCCVDSGTSVEKLCRHRTGSCQLEIAIYVWIRRAHHIRVMHGSKCRPHRYSYFRPRDKNPRNCRIGREATSAHGDVQMHGCCVLLNPVYRTYVRFNRILADCCIFCIAATLLSRHCSFMQSHAMKFLLPFWLKPLCSAGIALSCSRMP